MIKFTKPHIPLYILNALAFAFYILMFFNLNLSVSNEIAFSSTDAKTYNDVANWLAHGIDSESVSTRPILYPLILLISTKIGGAYGIWILQIVFWFLAINFTFLGIKQITKSGVIAFLGAFIILSNLSLIALTFHALTELTTVFLLSAMLFVFSKKIEQFREISFFHTGVLFLVLLTIVKPVFSIPLFCVLLIAFPLFYLKKHWKRPKNFLKLFLILLPLLIQLTIIKTKYNQTKISLISEVTFSKYFVAQGVEKIESISRDVSIVKAVGFSSEEQTDYLVQHASFYSDLFRSNIIDNVTGKATFLMFPAGYGNQRLAKFMKSYNIATLKIHYIFILLVLVLLLILLRKKNYSMFIFLLFMYGLGFYYIIVTGISFWQGDRLTLPSISIWAFIYPLTLFYYYKLLFPARFKLDRDAD